MRLLLNCSDSQVWIYGSCWCLYVLSCTKICIYRLPVRCLSYRAFSGFALLGCQSSCCSWVQLQTHFWALPHFTGQREALNRMLQTLLTAPGHTAGGLSAVCSWWLWFQTASDIFLGSAHSLCADALHNIRGSQSPFGSKLKFWFIIF